jgi:hypothetical protein
MATKVKETKQTFYVRNDEGVIEKFDFYCDASGVVYNVIDQDGNDITAEYRQALRPDPARFEERYTKAPAHPRNTPDSQKKMDVPLKPVVPETSPVLDGLPPASGWDNL